MPFFLRTDTARKRFSRKWAILLRPFMVLVSLSGLVIVLVSLSLAEISIVLAIFCAGAWQTLPYAFHEKIERQIEKREKELKRKKLDNESTEE